MSNEYDRIITTLTYAIDCSTDKETEDDLKMAIAIIKEHIKNTKKQATSFEPIVDYETGILIDRGTNNYGQIRANFREFSKRFSKEELKLRLEQVENKLKLLQHNHECLEFERIAYQERIESLSQIENE